MLSDQLAPEQGLCQQVHAEAACLCLHNDEIIPIETETLMLILGCDPMFAAQDNDSVNPPLD
jgi:hypothetical protein